MPFLQPESTTGRIEEPLDGLLKVEGSISDTASSSGVENLDDLDKTLSKQFADEIRNLAWAKSHRKVAVQLLSWEFEGEGCLNTTQEQNQVEDLKNVFESRYNFTVLDNKIKSVNTEKPPRYQLSSCLSSFLEDHDRKDTLLIIYYGGHGIGDQKDGRLGMVTRNGLTKIVWNSTEHLLDDVEADVLLIFDCCHAGILERNTRSPGHPIYEFIGSTPFNKTALGPGPRSFTRALINSLEKLSERRDGFTTMELLHEIKVYPDFLNSGQQPVSSERGKKSSFRKLQIKPLLGHAEQLDCPADAEKEEQGSFRCYLTLRYALSQKLTPANVTSLTRSLHSLVTDEHVPVRHVTWCELAPKMSLRDVAKMVLERSSRDRHASSISVDESLQILNNDDNQISPGLTMSPIQEHDSIAYIPEEDMKIQHLKDTQRVDSNGSNMSYASRQSFAGTTSHFWLFLRMIVIFTIGVTGGVTFAQGPDLVRPWLKF